MTSRWALLAIVLLGCGSHLPPRPTLVVGPNVSDLARLEAVEVLLPESSAEAPDSEAETLIALSQDRYLSLDLEGALSALSDAQVLTERSASEPADFLRLQRVLVLRAMCYQALDRESDAVNALRNAVVLAPDEPLDTSLAPPPVQELFAEVRDEVRTEAPVVLPVASSPTGAEVRMDGRAVGQTPVSVHTNGGRHFIEVTAFGHERRLLPVDVSGRPEGLQVNLPPLGAEALALAAVQQSALSPRHRDSVRTRLGAELVLRPIEPHLLDGLDLDTGTRVRSSGASWAEALELARVRPEPPPTLWESGWLWAGVATAIAVAGGLTAYFVLKDPGAVLRLAN